MNNLEGDVAAERALLAGLARHGVQALVDIDEIISSHSFTHKNNKIVFSCLRQSLEDSPTVDVPSVLSASHDLGLSDFFDDSKNVEFLKALFLFPIELKNVRKHAVKLRKLEMAREIQSRLQEAYNNISNITGNEPLDEILSLAETPIFNLSNELNKTSDERPQRIFEGAVEYLNHLIENKVEQVGISTGFPNFDKAIGGGLRRGYVDLWVARPKTGKTTVAKQVALFITKKVGIPVLMLDTEMNKNDQLHRSIASETMVHTNKIETGQFGDTSDKGKVFDFVRQNVGLPYFYKSIAGKPFEEVLSIIRRWVMLEVGVDDNGNTKDCVIIYDYFKLMDESTLDNMQEYQALGFQISKLTSFCNQYQVPCLAFVQANRDGILKETTDIIAQSDRLLWLCASASLLRRKTQEEQADDPMGNMILKPLECRFGPGLQDIGVPNYINMRLQGDYSKIEELGTRQQSLAQNNNGALIADADDEDSEDGWESETLDDNTCPFSDERLEGTI